MSTAGRFKEVVQQGQGAAERYVAQANGGLKHINDVIVVVFVVDVLVVAGFDLDRVVIVVVAFSLKCEESFSRRSCRFDFQLGTE